jgi:DNA polymerase III epsilon subunit-like protein
MPITFLGIDTETTGLKATENQIIDICLILINEKFEVVDELSAFAHPDENAIVDPIAVRVNGYSREVWEAKGATTQHHMARKVYDFIAPHSRLKLIAHNVNFDEGFLKALLAKHALPTWTPYGKMVDYHNLDTMGIAMFLDFVGTGTARKSYRLASLTEDYGIEHEGAHTARSDIHACLNLLKAMRDVVAGKISFTAGAPRLGAYSKIIACMDSVAGLWEFNAGTHKGHSVVEIAKEDPGYIRYVLTFNDLSPEQRAHLEQVHKEYIAIGS